MTGDRGHLSEIRFAMIASISRIKEDGLQMTEDGGHPQNGINPP